MKERLRIPADLPVAGLIRRARTAAGLTQKQLAMRLGTTQSAVSRWEHGHDEPRIVTLGEIMTECGLRLELSVAPDDVDRAQIRQQLAMTPEDRLASVANLSKALAGAHPVG